MSVNSFSSVGLPNSGTPPIKAAPSSKSLKRLSGSACVEVLELHPYLAKIPLELQTQSRSLKGEKL